MDAQTPKSKGCPISSQSARSQQSTPAVHPDQLVKLPDKPLSRRTLLKVGGAGAMATTLATVASVSWMPQRAGAMPTTTFSDIQFDIGAFVHPAQTIAGIQVDFGVLYTFLAPAKLTRNPSKADQATLENALRTIEANYPFSPSGVFTFVAYGLPYFHRLPSSLVASHMPKRNDGSGKPVLEEAVPSPTDFGVSGISKLQKNFQVPVRIETNDVLFTLRSDSLVNILDVSAWFNGSGELNGNLVPSPDFDGLFNFDVPRLNFVQPGLPRQLADTLAAAGAAPFTVFHKEVNPASSMWMGFVDQQTQASAASGAIVTFAGTSHAHLTTAVAGDYFDNGSIMHLSHVLEDLQQFYNKDPNFGAGDLEDYSERLQYMFHSFDRNGNTGLLYPQDANDGFTNGGGQGAPTGGLSTQQLSAFLPNGPLGTTAQDRNFDPTVTDHNKYRVGHTSGLQRSSRAADGTPLHIRNDGPGLSTLDVPDGSLQPTLEFMAFVPTAEFFRVMRINSASVDYVKPGGANGGTAASVDPGDEAADDNDDGLERFLSATRRQNFLIPPRRHRSFPLTELT